MWYCPPFNANDIDTNSEYKYTGSYGDCSEDYVFITDETEINLPSHAYYLGSTYELKVKVEVLGSNFNPVESCQYI